MKRIIILIWSILLTFTLSACGNENNFQEVPETPTENSGSSNENKEQTAITLTIGEKVLNAYLNNNTAATDLLSRLPVTVRLTNSGHDYYGDIIPALSYKKEEIQSGWKNGDLAFWITGNDFVIFHDDEETSSSTGNIVVIGHVTDDIDKIRELDATIDVKIDRKDNNNQTEDDMNQSAFNIKVKFDNRELSATLLNNATTRAFVEKLPVTLPMLDLYNRELCYRFPKALPTDDVNTCGYEIGEIVYYPPMHSFVILFAQNREQFSMQKLGRINSGVSTFNNIGNVDVTFELVDE